MYFVFRNKIDIMYSYRDAMHGISIFFYNIEDDLQSLV